MRHCKVSYITARANTRHAAKGTEGNTCRHLAARHVHECLQRHCAEVYGKRLRLEEQKRVDRRPEEVD